MCYKINQHHLIHDVRPLVSYSGLQKSVDLVNPYAAPRRCCNQIETIAKWFVCPAHGCCYLTSRIVQCTAAQGDEVNCGILTEYHTYEERVPLVEGDKTWAPLPAFEQEIGMPENSHEKFQPHHNVVFDMGSEVEDLGEELQSLVADLFTFKAIYDALENDGWRCDSHEICQRVLQSHECREFAIQKEMREIRGRLQAMEVAISALEVKFALRRFRFDAIAFGFTGALDINGKLSN